MPREGLQTLFTDDDRHGLAYLKDYRVGQVTTHGHDRPIPALLPSWKEFAGTMHRDNVPIPPGGKWSFDEIEGPGKITNIWCTAAPPIDFNLLEEKITFQALMRNWKHLSLVFPYHRFWNLLKKVWIQIYFDDEALPSVDAPLGDFFGVGFGEYKHFTSRYLMMTAGGYVCQFHMPFRKKARVEMVNKNENLWVPAFYGAVTFLRYENDLPLENQAYFHARYRQEHPTRRGEPYLILDTHQMGLENRPGHYVGVVLSTEAVEAKSGFAYLEGNTKIWVDGESEQSLEYTGLEDYFQGAWYYVKTRHRAVTEFCAPYHGLTVKSFNRMGLLGAMLLANTKRTRVCQYRFHPEGIPFGQSIHISCHHGEFDEIAGNYSSVAYWYQRH
jgi:hypothetical protein